MIKIQTNDGLTVGTGVLRIYKTAFNVAKVKSNVGKTIKDVIAQHWSSRFPGSRHYDPQKVVPQSDSVLIKVPGVSRAYHDVVIRPTKAQYLAIPMHRSAYGISPRDMDGLFHIPGANVLWKEDGRGLSAMYALSKIAYQRQDKTIMPSDYQFKKAIGDRFVKNVKSAMKTI